jgi:hypothetical protein
MTTNKADNLSLLNKYQILLIENDRLKAENKKLKAQLGIYGFPEEMINELEMPAAAFNENEETHSDNSTQPKHISPIYKPHKFINQNSSPGEKIKLFISLYKGREDVYAKRWQNKNGKSGYAPACFNEWKHGLCIKPKIKCSECNNKSFESLNEKVIEEHLKGNIVAGIYPMRIDEKCYFLSIDFDDEGWEKDTTILRNSCKEFDIPFAVERSRSGNGAHVWFFFKEKISAALARKFGTSLLTYSMSKRHEIKFKSYDRFFPNQDTMPRGGFGNLIALPLQMEARKKGNSVFIDGHFKPYSDQWKFMGTIRRLSEDEVERFTAKLSVAGNELGLLRKDNDESSKPWERVPPNPLTQNDFPEKINLVKANMIYIPKGGISQKALNVLKRLAAFKNPEFYKAQAMRMPTYNKPRIISCSDETENTLVYQEDAKKN